MRKPKPATYRPRWRTRQQRPARVLPQWQPGRPLAPSLRRPGCHAGAAVGR
jgi:hypothetical protein